MNSVELQSTPEPKEGLVHAVIGGTFGTVELSALKTWTEKLRTDVGSVFRGTGKPVKVLIDIRGLQTYTDPSALTILAELMKKDNPFVYKTASFGGTAGHEIAQDVIKIFAGRSNLRNFKSEEEARAWLQL